jgi:hypothetical protein
MADPYLRDVAIDWRDERTWLTPEQVRHGRQGAPRPASAPQAGRLPTQPTPPAPAPQPPAPRRQTSGVAEPGIRGSLPAACLSPSDGRQATTAAQAGEERDLIFHLLGVNAELLTQYGGAVPAVEGCTYEQVLLALRLPPQEIAALLKTRKED